MSLGAPPAVSVDNVDVVLSGVPIVRHATFEIAQAQTVAITGNNGSGKTTLMRALLGLVPHHGTIRLFGTELGRFRDWRRIGYVPQRSSILVQQATVPVIETGVGVCHVYIDESADLSMAADIIENAKCSRPAWTWPNVSARR